MRGPALRIHGTAHETRRPPFRAAIGSRNGRGDVVRLNCADLVFELHIARRVCRSKDPRRHPRIRRLCSDRRALISASSAANNSFARFLAYRSDKGLSKRISPSSATLRRRLAIEIALVGVVKRPDWSVQTRCRDWSANWALLRGTGLRNTLLATDVLGLVLTGVAIWLTSAGVRSRAGSGVLMFSSRCGLAR